MKTTAKLVLIVCLAIGLVIAFTGCTSSYMGSADYDIPLSKQATLIIPFDLRVTKFGDYYVSWRNGDGKLGGDLYVNIPEGTYDLTFDYLSVDEYSSGGQTYERTRSASNLKAAGKFEAGNTYKAYVQYLSGNKVQVVITNIKKGKAKNSFAGPETQISYSLGGISTVPWGFSYSVKSGMVFDNITRMAWNIETGFGAGIADLKFKDFGGELFAGANYEVYFNRKGIGGLSLGGGLVWPLGELYPYAKIAVPFVLGGAKLGLYGTWYFTDFIIAELDEPLLHEKGNLKQFGFGIYFSR